MLFSSILHTLRAPRRAKEDSPTTVIGDAEARAKTGLDRLREIIWLKGLPDTLEVPVPDDVPLTVVKPILDVSVDDVAFALQILDRRSSDLYQQIHALRRLHDLARQAGAVGTANAVAAAIRTAGVAR